MSGNDDNLEKEVNREYKSSLFCDIFSDEERLKDLYLGVSGERVPPGAAIKINTLKNVLFYGVANDISFSVGDQHCVLTEHQSTINKNMPLRLWIYAAELYKRFISDNNIYRERQIFVPSPLFYGLYNGKAEQPEEWELKLSDAYMSHTVALELKVKMYNINYGQGRRILERSVTLRGYSVFVWRVRELVAGGSSRTRAVKLAIDYCIQHGYLRDYFTARKEEEVSRMLDIQWNLEDALAVRGEEKFEEGIQQGREETAIEMLRDKFSPEKTARYSKLSLDRVISLGRQYRLL